MRAPDTDGPTRLSWEPAAPLRALIQGQFQECGGDWTSHVRIIGGSLISIQ